MILRPRALAVLGLGLLLLLGTQSWQYLLAWGGLCLALFILDWLVTAKPSTLVLRRSRLPSVRLSQSTQTLLTVVNPGRRTRRGLLRDAWQPSAGAQQRRHRLLLRGGEAGRFTTTLHPTRRGILKTDWVTVRLRSPLGLVWRQFSAPVEGELRVLPEFHSRRHLPSRLARLREMDGRTAVNVRGQGTEFDSLREYVLGDDVRAIDWRATARRQELVVRTWRPERDRRVFIVVDTSRLAAVRLGDEPRLDAAIEAALLLVALASHAGDRVDVLAVDAQVRARVSEHQGDAVMASVADALGPLQPTLVEPDWSLAAGTIRSALSQRALVVFLTAVDPGALESGLIPTVETLAADHQLIVAGATDPQSDQLRFLRENEADLFTAAAAERAAADRREVARLLTASGAQVVQQPQQELSPAVADVYLAMKAAGRL